MLGAQAAQKRARLLLECNQITRGGGDRHQEAACWLENSDSSGEKFEGQTTCKKRKQKCNSKKMQRHQQPDTVRSQLLCSWLPVTHSAGSNFSSDLLWAARHSPDSFIPLWAPPSSGHPRETLHERHCGSGFLSPTPPLTCFTSA